MLAAMHEPPFRPAITASGGAGLRAFSRPPA
jgi:hypothetical protein